MNNPSTTQSRLFGWLLAAWIVISFGLRLLFLDNLRWTYDEGIHVLFAQMLARGFEPYREVFVSYPPLYTLSMDWTWRIFGTVESLQILMSAYTMLGLLAVGLIGWRLSGSWAGLSAAILVSLEPEFFRGSRAVLTEVPSLSVAALAVAFAAIYLWQIDPKRERLWLIASGIALAVSLMLKILSPHVLGLIPLMILVRHGRRPEIRAIDWGKIIRDGLLWGLAVLLPILALSLLYDLPSLYDQAIRFRFATRGAYEGEVNNFRFALSFLQTNGLMSLLAAIGLIVMIRQKWAEGWFVVVWLLLAFTFAMIQVPLRDKHLPLLLMPLAILAGLGLAGLVRLARNQSTKPLALRLLGLAAVGLVVSLYLWQTAQVLAQFGAAQTQYLNEDNHQLVAYISRFTAPNDCLITDDPTLAFISDRPVPPALAEASSARLRSGYLTTDDLIAITTAHECQIVAPVAVRFKRSAPDFVEWAKSAYLGLWLYDNETEVLMAKPTQNSQPHYSILARFDDQVKLLGVDRYPIEANTTHLSFYWQALKPFAADYTVFVHVRDEANNTVINADHQPYDGRVSTSIWPVNQTIKESIRLDLPADIAPGTYDIYVGLYLYDGTNFNRLPLKDDQSGENAVVIGQLVVP